jgi:DNA uptake protein ComE-like DNA-binding protein
MDAQAAQSYRDFYENKVAYTQKKVSKTDFDKVKNQYKAYTEALFAKAMKSGNIFANVGPQMWFAGKINLSTAKSELSAAKKLIVKAFGKKDKFYEFRLDLNTATAEMFRMIGFAEADAAKLVEARDKDGFFKGGNPVNTIKKVLGDERFGKYNAVLNLVPYDHTKADVIAQYKEQSLVLWPEDIAKLAN